MSGVHKSAKTLTDPQIRAALGYLETTRQPVRDKVIFLLSAKAGMRAAEIAQLTWDMVLGPEDELQDHIELRDLIAKYGSGRRIPMHPLLVSALMELKDARWSIDRTATVLVSQRGGPMSAHTLVNWFRRHYGRLGYEGCSSHSGRRTMITRAARKASLVGASIRDVAQLAGHSSIQTTHRYIDTDTEAQRKLIKLI